MIKKKQKKEGTLHDTKKGYYIESKVLILSGKKIFFTKFLITQVFAIVQSYILVSGIEQTFLCRLVSV
jgi:hypothetical protein